MRYKSARTSKDMLPVGQCHSLLSFFLFFLLFLAVIFMNQSDENIGTDNKYRNTPNQILKQNVKDNEERKIKHIDVEIERKGKGDVEIKKIEFY